MYQRLDHRGWSRWPRVDDRIVPVANLISHPWVSYEAAYAKKPLRVRGNRHVRRVVRMRLHLWTQFGEDEEERLPTKLDGFDAWEIW